MSQGDIKINQYDQIVQTYEGVNIYLNGDQPYFYFTYKGLFYSLYPTQFSATQAVDQLKLAESYSVNMSDFSPTVDEIYPPNSEYRGVPVWLNIRRDFGTESEFNSWFYYKGQIHWVETGLPQLIPLIDAILDQPVAPLPTTPPIGSTPTPAPVDETTPPGLGWLDGVTQWFGNLTAWFVERVNLGIGNASTLLTVGLNGLGIHLGDQVKAQQAINGTLASLGESVAASLSAKTTEMIQQSIQEALNNVLVAVPGAVGDSPEWKNQLKASLDPYANKIVSMIQAEANPAKFAHSPITPEEAKDALNTISAGIVAVEIGLFIANAALEGATLGQVEAIKEIENMVISKLGASQISSAALTIPMEELVLKKARQYYAAEYTPEIPGYSDLINMLVKEKISREDFTKNFAYLGFEKRWADLIWDSHFQAPGLADILTAWRRGEITEERVNELMILVDLDPAYKGIFDTRKYVDPSLSLARFMYETGAIDETRVKEIVHRNGFRPDDEQALTDFVIRFQERRYRQRYLTTLATGYARGVVSVDELNKSVREAGYSQGTADWIVKSAEIRKEIAARVSGGGGPKLLALGDLKKAYINDKITEDQLRTELQIRDYQTADIQVLVDVLNLDKSEVVEGKKQYSLSISQMLKAFLEGIWSEDHVRTELMVRGLSLDEANVLIEIQKRNDKYVPNQGS